ncbi:WAT1-related protein [Tanacetum coccineum]
MQAQAHVPYRERGNVVKEKQSATSDLAKVTVCDEEAAGHDTNGLSEGTFHLTKAYDVPINVIDLPIDPNKSGPTVYAKLVTGEPSRKIVNFRTLLAPAGKGAHVAISLEPFQAISEHFANTVMVSFLKNGWRTPWLKTMLRTLGVNMDLSNQLASGCGLIIKRCGNVSIWVKLHGVPLMAFGEDGFKDIGTKVGTPLMLDSCTSDMCMQSWGRSSYAKAIIELRADVKLKDTIVVAMPKLMMGSTYHPQNMWQRKAEVSSKEVSSSNPFGALKSVENDDDLGMNGGNSKAVGKGSLNAAPGSSSTTPIAEKIDKLE